MPQPPPDLGHAQPELLEVEAEKCDGHCDGAQTGYTAYTGRESGEGLNCFHNKAQECGYTPGPLLFHGSIIVSVLFVDCKMGLAIHTITPAAGWASV